MRDWLNEARNRTWEWGVHDCFAFATQLSAEITGRDPAAALRASYSSAGEAGRAISVHGGLVGALSAFADRVNRPRNGDLTIGPGRGNRPACGVVIGASAVFADTCGYRSLPLRSCSGYWRPR